jgi:polyhydroxyalkanoate synthesis regulator phasin
MISRKGLIFQFSMVMSGTVAVYSLFVAYSPERASDIRTLLHGSASSENRYRRTVENSITELEENQERIETVIPMIMKIKSNVTKPPNKDLNKELNEEIQFLYKELQTLQDQKKLLTENLSDTLSKSESRRNSEIYSIQSLAAFIAGAGILLTLHCGRKIIEGDPFLRYLFRP